MHKSKEHKNVDKSLSFDNVNIYSDLKKGDKNYGFKRKNL